MIGHFPHIALGLDPKDRARRDTDNWRADVARSNPLWQQKISAAKQRHATQLKGLTPARLLTETPFTVWNHRPQIIPPPVAVQIRPQAHALLQALTALGPKAPRPAARTLLSGLVTWLNQPDANLGGLFETEERQDLMGFIEEACCAINKNLC